jgi:hypothetical protein
MRAAGEPQLLLKMNKIQFLYQDNIDIQTI